MTATLPADEPADNDSAERAVRADGEPGAELVEAGPADVLDQDPAQAGELVTSARLVDPPGGGELPAALVARPVLPAWCGSRAELVDAAGWAARHAAHVTAFHTLRLPLYWCRLAARSPIGAGRLIGRLWRWTTDADGHTVRAGVAGSGVDPRDFIRLTQQRHEIVRARLATTTAMLTLLALLGWAVVLLLPAAGLVATVVLLLAVLGVIGRAVDRPVTSRAVDSETVPRLTADLILTALGSLGIAELNKSIRVGGPGAVRFPAPIVRDGPGWRAELDLPPGVTAGDVIERRDRLASGLRRPVGAVWPGGDHDTHAGRLIVWVGDKPMSQAKPVPWPLAKTGRVDLFTPIPVGVDPKGRPVTVTLMFASLIIAAQPRLGKTFTLRLLLLAAALDPAVELHIYDLKGGADFLPLEGVAHRFRIGDEPDDITYLLADLRAIAADMPRRYKTVRSLPRDVCPEGKVTPQLAARRELGLWPIVVALDECQRAYEHPTHGGEIEALVTDLTKRGPAVGIIAISATQRPDAKSLPTGISSNAILRYCGKVAGQIENDMVLGTSAYKAGIRATMFSRTDRGVGYLAGEGDDPVIVRTAYLDAPTAERIAARARTARVTAGLLTGHAAGIDADPEPDSVSVLDHLAQVWPADADRLWWDDLAALLAAAHPDRYGDWTGEQVSSACKAAGLRGRQIKRVLDGRQINRRGLTRADLHTALTARDNVDADLDELEDRFEPDGPAHTLPAGQNPNGPNPVSPVGRRLAMAPDSTRNLDDQGDDTAA